MNSCFHVALRCPIRPYSAVSPGHAPISRRSFSPVMPSGKLLYSSFSAEHNRNPRSPSPKCVHCPSDSVSPFIPTHTCLSLLARFGNVRNHSMSLFYMIPCERLLHVKVATLLMILFPTGSLTFPMRGRLVPVSRALFATAAIHQILTGLTSRYIGRGRELDTAQEGCYYRMMKIG